MKKDNDTTGFFNKTVNIKEIPSLPAIVMKVNQMLEDQSTTIDSLSQVIEKDPAIVSKMLLLVNSAFFGLRGKISSVKEALIVLGFEAIRSIVISLSTFDRLNKLSAEQLNEQLDINDFWKHSIAVAVMSRYLSEKTGVGDPDKSFVNGLLHDIGKLIMACYFRDEFNNVIVTSQKENLSYLFAEKKVMSTGHSDVGYHVAQGWGLPVTMALAIHHHHGVQEECSSREDSILVNCADGIVNSYLPDSLNRTISSGKLIDEYFDPVSKKHKRMMLLLETSQNWFPDVLTLIREAHSFFFNKPGNTI